MKENLDNLYFSQSALNTFKRCPLNFKMKYVEGLLQRDFPNYGEIANKQEQGRKFHLIAERHFSGIETGLDDKESNPLAKWINTLKDSLPLEKGKTYYPEYEIRFNKEIKLQAKYDLIIKGEKGIYSIYDWKTEERPLRVEKYKSSLQTILYCFLLVEAGKGVFGENINADKVEMIYWQPINPYKPLIFKYSHEQYLKDKYLLENLVDTIMTFDFDRVKHWDRDKNICNSCDLKQMCI